jgi:hypothetical protein
MSLTKNPTAGNLFDFEMASLCWSGEWQLLSCVGEESGLGFVEIKLQRRIQ